MKLMKAAAACTAIIAVYFAFNAFGINPHNADNPSVPSPVSPVGGAITDRTPDLVFDNSTGGSGTRTYDIQVTLASDENFSNPVLTQSGIAENSSGQTTFTVTSPLEANTNHLWRVRCQVVSAHEVSAYSSGAAFTTNSTE